MKKYHHCVMLLMAILFASALTEGNTVKVILLGGQSNMDGRAPGSGLPTSPVNLQQEQTDVLFYQGNASGGSYLPGNTLIYLAPGSGSKSPSAPTFGPEVTFGRAIADACPHEQFALIKYGLGGSKLATDWNPATGAAYAAFRNTVAGGLAALTNAGYDYEIVGMLWMQGESDSTTTYANAYQANLTAFIADIRSRYGQDIPFVIGETWRNEGDSSHPGTLGDIVSGAQQSVANADDHVGFVSTRTFNFQDEFHLNASGQMNLGSGMADYLISNNLLSVSTSTLKSDYQADVIGHWSFDNEYSDVSRHGLDGTLVDAGTIGNSGITTTAGEFKWGGGAFNVSSERDYVVFDQTILAADGDGYSISFWGRDRNAVANQGGMAIGDYTSTNNFIWVDQTNGGMRYRATSRDYTADFTIAGGEDKNWHHYVVVVSDADNDGVVDDITLYVDGISVGDVVDLAADMSIRSIGHAYNSTTLNYDYDGQIDEVWLFSNAIDQAVVDSLYESNSPYPSAGEPVPANGQGLAIDPASALYAGVPVDQNLSWSAPADPNLDLSYVMTYAVYADPNRAKVENGEFETEYYRGFQDSQATQLSFDPQVDLSYDTTYYWRVDTMVRWIGQSDPNILAGPVWKFKTAGLLPDILTDPVNSKVEAGQTAQFQVTYQSISGITGVTWYKNDQILLLDSNHTVAWDQTASTLTIDPMSAGDEGTYYCVVATSAGTDTSASALLAEKKLLAWYEFEQNTDDSADSNNGTAVPDMAYSEGQVGSYAANPSGTNYIELSTNAYPKTGFGNGLDEFTYSCWVKLASGEGGVVLGTFNDDSSTGLRFSVNGAGNDISAYLRQEGGSSLNPATTALDTDNEWHYIALTYNGLNMTLYVDGVGRRTVTATLTNFADWQYPVTLVAKNSRGDIQERFDGQIDDLRIYNYSLEKEDIAQGYYDVTGKPSCILDYASSFDISGPDSVPDCVVDLYDFVEVAATWLNSGLYPLE